MTTQLVTNNYKLNMANQFVESFNEPANTIYYVFAGKSSEFANNDAVPNTIYDSITTTQFSAYNTMLFGKKIQPQDVCYLIPKNEWESDTVYAMYDDIDPDLKNKQFYVSVEESGTYYVFKCLYNNNGAESTVQPSYGDTDPADPYFETNDGYRWKYIYQIDGATYSKFNTNLYMPVLPDDDVVGNTVSGAVDTIIPTDIDGNIANTSGSKYDNYFSGIFAVTSVTNAQNGGQYCRLTTESTTNLPSTESGLYDGCYLYITDGTGAGQCKKITSHISNTSGVYVYLSQADVFTTIPDNSSTYEITPRVVILNSTNEQVNVIARALVDANTANSIYKVEVINGGADVMFANAFVYASEQVDVSNTAYLRVISSPHGGHGSNPQEEFFCSKVGISVKFANNESNTIPISNDYRTLGILKDPLFANVKLDISSQNITAFSDLAEVYQVSNTGTATGIVTSMTFNTEVNLTNVYGTFITGGETVDLDGTVDITNGEIGVVGTGTSFTTDFVVGEYINVDGSEAKKIGYIANDTLIAVTSPFGADYVANTYTKIYGVIEQSSTGANAVCDAIYINDVQKSFNTFNQLYRYDGSYIDSANKFAADQTVYQQNIDENILTSIAKFHSGNNSTIYLTEKFGPIYSSNVITSNTGSTFNINTVYVPDLVEESGTILYLEDFAAIERSNTQSETIKLVLEF